MLLQTILTINERILKEEHPEIDEGKIRRKMLIDLLNGMTDEEIKQIGHLKKKIPPGIEGMKLYLQGVLNYELTVTNNIFDQTFSDN